jgi:hypothetical protein
MFRNLSLLLTTLCICGGIARAADFGGDYTAQSPAGAIHLSIEQSGDTLISGEMYDGVSRFRLIGKRDGDTASGKVNTDVPPGLGFSAEFGDSDDQLRLQLYPLDTSGAPAWDMAQELVFNRSGGQKVAAQDSGTASDVVINGQPLTEQQVQNFEQQYQTKLVAGRYWYDKNCGAWGLEGGPTAGFILPALQLPGPMPANISGGGTGIFINGREIHPVDRQVLVGMFGMALPGRYWLDAYGNLGIEGGGVLVNLAVAAQQAGQHTTQTGAGTVSTGSSGAMFSGTNLSTGKPTFWYAGM